MFHQCGVYVCVVQCLSLSPPKPLPVARHRRSPAARFMEKGQIIEMGVGVARITVEARDIEISR